MKKFDLEERTALFGERVILFTKKMKMDSINRVLLNQLLRSATSVGANYMEANGAESKKDFKHKIAICKKEAKETKHWLRMLATHQPDRKKEIRILWQEAHELRLYFPK